MIPRMEIESRGRLFRIESQERQAVKANWSGWEVGASVTRLRRPSQISDDAEKEEEEAAEAEAKTDCCC